MTIDEFDIPYQEALKRIPETLAQSYESLVFSGPIALDGQAISEAILLRLSAFYCSQRKVNEFLEKKVASPAADYFVETILFFIRALIGSHRLNIHAFSEKKIEQTRKALRPDISLWREEKLLAIIECKTQLGWNRFNWKTDFELRQENVRKVFPNAKVYLVVSTALNWPLSDDEPLLEKQLFVLSHQWPSEANQDNVKEAVHSKIERLFNEILTL